MIPTRSERDAWRRKASQGMSAALGEYSPPELEVLLDAVDTMEAALVRLRRDALLASSVLDAREQPDLARALRHAAEPLAPRGPALGSTAALKAAFSRHADEYCKFESVERPYDLRRDACALALLDRLQPAAAAGRMFAEAQNGEIWLNVDVGELAVVITEADVKDLLRCGVRLDSQYAALSMRV